MTLKRFLYFLLKPDGRSGKIQNGVVTYSGTPTPLPQTPQGWEELMIGWERSLLWHGIIRSFTVPLGFVRDGAKIIRDALYNQSIEEELQLLVLRLVLQYNPVTFNWFYEYFYRGELDLSTVEDGQDMLQAQVMEGGISKLLQANRKTIYEFPFDEDSIVIEMDGIPLTGKGSYAIVDGVEIDNALYGDSFWLPFQLLNADGLAPGLAFVSQQIEDTSGQSLATRLASNNYFAINTGTTSLNLRLVGKAIITCTQQDAANGLTLRFLRSGQNTGNQGLYLVATLLNPQAGQVYSFDFDVTIPLAPDERLFFEGKLATSGVHTKIMFNPGSLVSAEFVNRFKTTYVPAFSRDVLYRKLVGKILGDESLASSALCLLYQNLCVTCFDAVRGFEGATLKTSLDDFFGDTDATLCAGIGIENGLLVLEARSHFYDASNPIPLGKARNVKHKPAVELLANVFKFGHPKPSIEDVNGKYDPNGSMLFTGPITRVVKDYDMISPYKAGPYEIELTRVNLEGKTTTDTLNENDVCVINADGSKVVQTEAVFTAAQNTITLPHSVKVRTGQRIQIQGSALNNATYVIQSVGDLIIAKIIVVDTPVVDEASVPIIITFLTGAVYTLVREVYDELEGIPTDQVFNIKDLTPKRMFMKHWAWIKSMHYGLTALKAKYQSGDKNTDLRTVVAGVEIVEKADVLIADMGTIMFNPVFDSFENEVPVNLAEILESSPNRCFSYIDEDDNEWIGFLFGAGIAPNSLQQQEFKILSAPANDLTLLVD